MPVLVLGVALSIWASFGFRYSCLNPELGPPARQLDWQHFRNRSATVNSTVDFAREHRLLPEAYIFGLAHTLHTGQERAAFLNGEFRQRGWLSFFPYCLAVKTPLELFVVLALGVAALVRFRQSDFAWRASPDGAVSGTLYALAPLGAFRGLLVCCPDEPFEYWAATFIAYVSAADDRGRRRRMVVQTTWHAVEFRG